MSQIEGVVFLYQDWLSDYELVILNSTIVGWHDCSGIKQEYLRNISSTWTWSMYVEHRQLTYTFEVAPGQLQTCTVIPSQMFSHQYNIQVTIIGSTLEVYMDLHALIDITLTIDNSSFIKGQFSSPDRTDRQIDLIY